MAFLVLVIGMSNADASFQTDLNKTLQSLIFRVASSPYIDYVITFSKEFKQHLNDLKENFLYIKDAKFKTKTRRCRFGLKETKLLDFISSKAGVKMNPNKCKSIQDYPVPRSSKDVFFGLAPYYCKFIRISRTSRLHSISLPRKKFFLSGLIIASRHFVVF